MRKVFSAGSYVEAQLVRGYLENAGVPVQIVNENSSGTPGSPHWALPVAAEIWVLEDHREQDAIRILKEYFEEQAAQPGTEWQCRSCKEDNPASFEICWNCGHASA